MQADSKSIIFIIGALLLLGLLGELFFYFNITQFNTVTRIITAVGRLGALILLLRHGTLIKSKPFFQIILIFLGLSILGAMIKILHWPFANLILLTGLIGTLIIYSLHFLKKKNKYHLDIVKILWVVVFNVSAILLIQHFPYGHELRSLEGILFLIMFADFASEEYQRSK